jgi:hypothetical protein
MRMDPVKVAGVAEWPVLTVKQEVQSFLGFMNFHQQFIEGFSHHVKPSLNSQRRIGSGVGEWMSSRPSMRSRITLHLPQFYVSLMM